MGNSKAKGKEIAWRDVKETQSPLLCLCLLL